MLWRTQFFLVLFVAMTIMLAAFLNCMTLLWATWPRSGPSDVTAPTISSVVHVAQIYDPYLFVGRVAVFRVTFSEAMDQAYGTGTRLQLNIATPAGDEWADFVEWESPTVARYSLTITAAMSDTNGISANSLDINSGDLKDLAGNNADLVFDPIPLDDIRVVMRGMFYGTDFTQGADAQKLYATIGGTQISASTGTRGDGTGSDATDPTWDADGAAFDGGDYFSSLPYSGLLDKIDNPGVYSIYGLIYVSSNTPKRFTIFTSVGGGADWAAGGTEFALYQDGRVTATNNHALGGTYIMTPDVAWRTEGWHTCAWVSDGTTVKFYWDGLLDSHTFTGYATTTLQTTPANVRIGTGEFGMTNMVGGKMRAFTASNVAHSDAEVSANHSFLMDMVS